LDGLEVASRRSWDNAWLDIKTDERSVTLLQLPDETAVPFNLNVQLVIELYALSA
jgi:ribosomal protein S4